MNGDLAQMQLGRLVVNVEILLAVEDVGIQLITFITGDFDIIKTSVGHTAISCD
jgi:hypothetical protein